MRKSHRGKIVPREFVRTAVACLGSLLILCTFVGCAAHRDYVEERHFTPAPETPVFLNASVMTILSNAPNFGAECRIERGSGIKDREGALLHRGNQILFSATKRKKKDPAGDMTYLWNISENSGYAINDPLTGYAAIGGTAPVAKVDRRAAGLPPEKIDGHLCHQEEVLVTSADGLETRFIVASASDLGGVPLRIRCEGGGPQFTLELHDVRMQEPAANLFELPSDFTRYATVNAMFEELFRRQSFGRPRQRQDLQRDEDDNFEGQRPFRSY
jgi:hypothetical protein